MVSLTPRPLFTPGKDTVRIVEEAGWTPGPVWTGVENLAHTGIRSPDCPACSQSLYQLSYPPHPTEGKWVNNNQQFISFENFPLFVYSILFGVAIKCDNLRIPEMSFFATYINP